ncbi:helix-turn-helix transcriptional regulator, partial [Cobetia sp. SIMBA_158]|uniref:helix-turn-helix domain-containing protein n=1 Tax=Cobetia sp. SIMBA_158 TaxID=3081617 RepID=UPI00397F8301
LRLKRIERHLKLVDVAEAIGISKNYMSEIERMKKLPSDEVIEKLAEFFGFEEKYLYDRFQRIPSSVASEIIGNEKISGVLYEISKNDELS